MTSKATAAEANDESTVTVEWRDLKFDLPTDRDEWPAEAALALEDGKYLAAVRALVPPDQFAALMATGPKVKDLTSLTEAVASALGFSDAGESPASSA